MAKAQTRRHACTGTYRSVWFGDLPYHAQAQRNAYLVADMSQAIVGLRAHAESFDLSPWAPDGCYTPDLAIEFFDGRLAWCEVRSARQIKRSARLRARLEMLDRFFAMRGGHFIVWVDTDLRREPRLYNARRLRASAEFCNDERVETVETIIARLGLPLSLGALEDACGGDRSVVAAALGLCAKRRLAIDLDAPIGPQALLLEGLM